MELPPLEIQPQGIPFTQLYMPDGRQGTVFISLPPEPTLMARALMDAECRFEIELLSDYITVSAEVVRPTKDDPEVIAGMLCPNGPQIPIQIEAMIREAFEKLKLKL